MKKANIGLDIDDVVLDFVPNLIRFFNRKYNKRIMYKHIFSYDLWKCGIGRDVEEAKRIITEFSESPEFRRLPLVEGVSNFIKNYREYFRFMLISSRAINFDAITWENLRYHRIRFPLVYSSGYFNKGKKKFEICKEFGINYFVEDCPAFALECAKNGIMTFLLDKPYNQEVAEEPNLERAVSFKEIEKRIQENKAR